MASRLFGGHFRRRRDDYESLRRSLIQSRTPSSVDQWLSMSLLASLVAAIFASVIGSFLLYAVRGPGILGSILTMITTSVALSVAAILRYGGFQIKTRIKSLGKEKSRRLTFRRLILIQLTSILGGLLLGGALVSLFPQLPAVIWRIFRAVGGLALSTATLLTHSAPYIAVPLTTFFVCLGAFRAYPRIVRWERSRKIDDLMPSAVSLMGSVAGVGLTPFESMKFLAREDVYGAMSEEMTYLVRDVELFGMDVITALRKLSEDTASEKLRSFIQGGVATITSGGRLREYLTVKGDEYSRSSERELDEYLESLGMIAEIFLIIGVVTPTLIVVMFSLISMMGKADIIILYVTILIVPVVTFLISLYADSAEPSFLR